MTRLTIGIDRAIAFLVGAALVAFGLGMLLWWLDVEWVRSLVAYADRDEIAAAPRQFWWRWLLAFGAILLVLGGIALLAANLRPRRVRTVELTGTTEFGSYTAHAGQVANAAAELLARHHAVASASASTVVEHGRRAVRITLVAEPDVTVDHLRRLAAESVRDVTTALAGADIAVDVFVHTAPATNIGAVGMDGHTVGRKRAGSP